MIEIYQVNSDNEVPYIFMSYDYAQKVGIEHDDYIKVLSFNKSDIGVDNLSDDAILNVIWDKGNTGVLQQQFKTKNMRSISMSDIIKIDGKAYYVDTFGFKGLDF